MGTFQVFVNSAAEFAEAFLFEVIFFIFFSGGMMGLLISKVKSSIDQSWTGVSRIHKKGKDVRNIKKSINKAKTIYILGFVPYNFVFDNREILTSKIKHGCKIKVLFCEYNSPVIKELSQIDNGTDGDIANKIGPLYNQLRSIKADAGAEATGVFEVRECNTEIRNPVIICFDKDNNKTAFMTLSMPPKRSIDCLMVEFRGKKCNDLIKYFDTIWDRHSNWSTHI